MAEMFKVVVASPTLGRVLRDPDALGKTQRLVDTFSEEKCRALAEVCIASGTWQVPTLIRLETMQEADADRWSGAAELRYVAKGTRRFWEEVAQQFGEKVRAEGRATLSQLMELELRMVKIFDKIGVPMLAGTDYGGIWVIPGLSLHQEFDLLGRAGLSPFKVLQMTTLDAARFLGREETDGSVEEGKNANLVLLDANPLESVDNLHGVDGVVQAGRYSSRGVLERLKREVAERIAAEPAA